VERCTRWPAGAAAARVHRRWKTPTRPFFARYSRAPSWPRALVRLLQMCASTSTTGDRSNIPNHRDRGWDNCRRRKVAFRSRATAEGAQGQGSRTPSLDVLHHDCSGRDFAPTPIASGTSCREHRPLACLERRGKKTMPPPRRPLAWRAPSKGRAAPDFREEIRRSPTRGAFCRRVVRDANGRSSMVSKLGRTRATPFSPPENLREGRPRRTR
jgi:hypothetical protein